MIRDCEFGSGWSFTAGFTGRPSGTVVAAALETLQSAFVGGVIATAGCAATPRITNAANAAPRMPTRMTPPFVQVTTGVPDRMPGRPRSP
jgi:hypothetical protein